MIVTRLCGGLGNQLFQYAAGKRLSVIHNTELVVDASWYTSVPSGNTYRDYQLYHYPITARLANEKERRWCKLHSNLFFGRTGISWGGWRTVKESDFNYQPALISQGDNLYLSGYWQSPLYFCGIEDQIRSELTLGDSFAGSAQDLARKIKSVNAVSVHIRRGDYVTSKSAAAFHGVCSANYYALAIEYMLSNFMDVVFFVFSDDINWVSSNMTFPPSTVFVTSDPERNDALDLKLMSTCRSHIIANSTFSWWAAWLNPSKTKVVIAPSVWFKNRPQPLSILPTDWITFDT
jgi:hypothetical protein